MAEENLQVKKSLAAKTKQFVEELWSVPSEGQKSVKRRLIILARIVYTVAVGIAKKRILVQASSLSYATLLAVGPILAITIMFSSMFFKHKDKTFVYDNIMSAVTFVMPAFNEMMKNGGETAQPAETQSEASAKSAPAQAGGGSAEAGRTNQLNPAIYDFIDNISKSSARAGAVGAIAMIVTCLLLFINMETAFNYIWGVSVGRKWSNRIVFYFVMIFFGSVGSIFAAALFATSTIAKIFGGIGFIKEYVPWITYGFGVIVMIAVLSCFYKFIPYTKVNWKPAIVGATVVTILLLLNNKGSFLYISYIAKQESLYGYLAIVAVAMFCLYIFWAVLLSGGLISYAVQFVGFYDDDQAWNKIGGRTKRMCALAVFAEVSKEFYERGRGADNLDELSQKLKLPKVLLSMCVKWLVEKDILCLAEGRKDGKLAIKPSISPDSITVGEFMRFLAENQGDRSINERLSGYENAVKLVLSSIDEFSKNDLFSQKIRDVM